MFAEFKKPSLLRAIVLILLSAGVSAQAPPCPRGSFKKAGSCELCPPGTYSDEAGATTCTPCFEGTFSSDTGAQTRDVCQPCPTGSVTDGEGSTKCSPCKNGTVPTLGASACVRCGSGSEVGFDACRKCDYGRYSSGTNNLACTICDNADGFRDLPGFLTKRRGATSIDECIPCEEGTGGPSVDDGLDFPLRPRCDKLPIRNILCAAGFFVKNRKCTPCPKDTFAFEEEAHRKSCKKCPPGSGTAGPGGSLCKRDGFPCPTGWFVDKTGNCQRCQAGFRLNEASKMCIRCGKNEISEGGNVISCKSCGKKVALPPATSKLGAGPRICRCPAGFFRKKNGDCAKCPAGTSRGTQADEDDSECDECLPGFFAANPGSHGCNFCPSGTISGPRATKCTKCPKGLLADRFDRAGLGRPFCVSPVTGCPPGATLEGDVISFCKFDKCPANFFKRIQDGEEMECVTCDPGRFAIPTDFLPCESCSDTSVSAGGAVQSCTECKNGFRQGRDGSKCVCESPYFLEGGQCKPCPPGTFGGRGIDRCMPCPAGTFSDFPASFFCDPCPADTFSDPGATSCKKCPKGTITYGFGEKTCLEKEAGSLQECTKTESVLKKCSPKGKNCRLVFTIRTCKNGKVVDRKKDIRTRRKSCSRIKICKNLK